MVPDLSHATALTILLGLTLYAAVIDIRSMIIPDQVNLAIFVCGLAASFFLGIVHPVSALAGSVLGGGLLFIVMKVFRSYRGYDGLGLGDVKFTAAAATWTGIEGLAFALALASLSALLYMLARQIFDSRFDSQHPIPFGPFLGLGATLVAGFQILTGLSMTDVVDAWLPRLAFS